MRKMRRDLDEYRGAIKQDKRSSLKQAARSDYEILEQRYRDWKQEHDRVDRELKTKQRDYKKSLSDFRFKSSAARVARQFKVVLKDDTELQARLVGQSEEHDLALLKVDGYRTPALKAYQGGPLPQGSAVFAVGSPLGLRDYVTSGIVTRWSSRVVVRRPTLPLYLGSRCWPRFMACTASA